VVSTVSDFLDQWPPLKPAWRPTTEAKVKAELCGGKVIVQGKVDLALGAPAGTTAGRVLVELKTGGFRQQHLDDLAGAGVGRPFVLGLRTEHHRAHGAVEVDAIALRQETHLQPTGVRDPAAVGLLQLGEHAQQRGLAVSVAPYDADPISGPDSEADLLEQSPDAVGLVDAFEVDQVGDGRTHDSATLSRALRPRLVSG